MAKYPIVSLHLFSLQNNLCSYTGHVENNHSRRSPEHPTHHTEGGFSQVLSFVTMPTEKTSFEESVALHKYPCGWLAVFWKSARHSSFDGLRIPPALPSSPNTQGLGWGGGAVHWQDRRAGCYQVLVTLPLVAVGPGESHTFSLRLSVLICKYEGFILRDLHGTSQLPGPDFGGSILRSFTEWPRARQGASGSWQPSPHFLNEEAPWHIRRLRVPSHGSSFLILSLIHCSL